MEHIIVKCTDSPQIWPHDNDKFIWNILWHPLEAQCALLPKVPIWTLVAWLFLESQIPGLWELLAMLPDWENVNSEFPSKTLNNRWILNLKTYEISQKWSNFFLQILCSYCTNYILFMRNFSFEVERKVDETSVVSPVQVFTGVQIHGGSNRLSFEFDWVLSSS